MLLRRIQRVALIALARRLPAVRQSPRKIVLLTNAQSPRWPMCVGDFDRILDDGPKPQFESMHQVPAIVTWSGTCRLLLARG